jgi:hypothetical protein
VLVDGLKALDPNQPIREADISGHGRHFAFCARSVHLEDGCAALDPRQRQTHFQKDALVNAARQAGAEAQLNVELMWLTGRLGAPTSKPIADFRKDNGLAIRATCHRFINLRRRLDLFTHAVAAIDGSKFKAVNARDKNFTKAK